MNGNPMTTHEEFIRNLLAEFMDEIEEWGGEVAGTPTPQELTGLDNIYDDYIQKLDEVTAKSTHTTKSLSAVPSKPERRICEWCQEPNTRFAGSPYMADTADMCIKCYAFTYQNHKDEIMPWDMVEIK